MMSSESETDEGDQHDAHHQTRGHDRGSRLHPAEPVLAEDRQQERTHRQQREEAVDDGGDARQDLEQRLGDRRGRGGSAYSDR